MNTNLSPKFTSAVNYALLLHADQRRKGPGGIPYVAHLMSVAALVVENGGSGDEAIGALLHDAVEDQGGAEQLKFIRKTFGERVAEIVLGCTDTDPKQSGSAKKEDWKIRKVRYLEHLAQTSDRGILLVSASDKLHNARAVLQDIRKDGLSVYDRFNAGKDGTLEYYDLISKILMQNLGGYVAEELVRVVGKIMRKTREIEAGQSTRSSRHE